MLIITRGAQLNEQATKSAAVLPIANRVTKFMQ